MTGLTILPTGIGLCIGLGLVSLALLALASWRGRWGLWVLGYLLTVAMLVTVFLYRSPTL